MNPDERIERLERTVRSLFWATAVACAVAVGALVLGLRGGAGEDPGGTAPGEIQATRFVVVDAHGRERGVFGMEKSNRYPLLALRDEEGVPRASLSVQRGAAPFSTLLLTSEEAGRSAGADLKVWPDSVEFSLSTSPRTSARLAVRGDSPEFVLGGENGTYFRAPE